MASTGASDRATADAFVITASEVEVHFVTAVEVAEARVQRAKAHWVAKLQVAEADYEAKLYHAQHPDFCYFHNVLARRAVTTSKQDVTFEHLVALSESASVSERQRERERSERAANPLVREQ